MMAQTQSPQQRRGVREQREWNRPKSAPQVSWRGAGAHATAAAMTVPLATPRRRLRPLIRFELYPGQTDRQMERHADRQAVRRTPRAVLQRCPAESGGRPQIQSRHVHLKESFSGWKRDMNLIYSRGLRASGSWGLGFTGPPALGFTGPQVHGASGPG
ncbi:unnamed protein product [Lota lota]